MKHEGLACVWWWRGGPPGSNFRRSHHVSYRLKIWTFTYEDCQIVDSLRLTAHHAISIPLVG